jgi:hypothetical protein
MRSRLGRSLLLAGCIVVACASTTAAFDISVDGWRFYRYGAAKVGEFHGQYRRSSGEKLRSIRVVAIDSAGRWVSGAQAKIMREDKEWAGGVGDFRAVGFYIEAYVDVRNSRGVVVRQDYYRSRVYAYR